MNKTNKFSPEVGERDVDTGAFSLLLLTLYQVAREHAFEQFQDLAVEAINEHVQFDSSCWATIAVLDGQHLQYGSHVSGAPADLQVLVNRTREEDEVRRQITRDPNTTMIFDAAKLRATPGSETIATYADAQQLMFASSFSAATNLLSFFAIARRFVEPAFTERERVLLSLLMPHLTALLNISRVAQMTQQRTCHAVVRSSMGAADGLGILHATEPGFANFLRMEWPEWSGPRLPEPMLEAIKKRRARVKGSLLNADLSWVREEVLVTLTRRSPLEALTPQEQAVSQAFAAGRSYKEVARDLQLAPATVRHHLRSVYAKIGVSDKAALAQAIAKW